MRVSLVVHKLTNTIWMQEWILLLWWSTTSYSHTQAIWYDKTPFSFIHIASNMKTWKCHGKLSFNYNSTVRMHNKVCPRKYSPYTFRTHSGDDMSNSFLRIHENFEDPELYEAIHTDNTQVCPSANMCIPIISIGPMQMQCVTFDHNFIILFATNQVNCVMRCGLCEWACAYANERESERCSLLKFACWLFPLLFLFGAIVID